MDGSKQLKINNSGKIFCSFNGFGQLTLQDRISSEKNQLLESDRSQLVFLLGGSPSLLGLPFSKCCEIVNSEKIIQIVTYELLFELTKNLI